jgi:hypothetical protein
MLCPFKFEMLLKIFKTASVASIFIFQEEPMRSKRVKRNSSIESLEINFSYCLKIRFGIISRDEIILVKEHLV